MEFTFSSGITVHLKPVSLGLIEKANAAFLANNPEPRKPTYIVKTENDVEEVHEHNETTLETDEEKAVYGAWEKSHDIWQTKFTENMVKVYATLGIEIIEDDTWIEEQEFFNISVPSGLARNYHYFETRLYGNPSDVINFLTAMARLQGVPSEQLEIAQSMFQSALQKGTNSVQRSE